jgi:hypothetical protein
MTTTITTSEQDTQSYINAGSNHADQTWKEAALAATMRLASRQQRFTSNDVLTELAKSNVTTHDLRAIGGVMREAKDLGLITSAGLVRRNDTHTRGCSILWQSRICQSAPAPAVNES